MQIFHGEDQITSRSAFLRAKQSLSQRGVQTLELSGDTLTLLALKKNLESTSLFGEKSIICLESFFSRRPSNDKKAIVEYLEKNSDLELYTWDSKDISSSLKNFPPKVVKRFDLPRYIFTFLDNLDLASYHKCLESLPPEQLLASIATRLHKVLVGQGRLNIQLSTDQIIQMSHQLLEIDYKQKTGLSPLDLAAALELWLVSIHNQLRR